MVFCEPNVFNTGAAAKTSIQLPVTRTRSPVSRSCARGTLSSDQSVPSSAARTR